MEDQFFLIVFFIPEQIMGFFTKDDEIIVLGKEYFRVSSFSYVFTAITFSYASILRSTGQIKLPMIINTLAIFINTFLNYLLIGGNMNFCLILEIITVWIIGFPLGFLSSMIFKMPITVVFTLITVQEIYKFISCAKRFKSKKWINNLIKLEGMVE